MNLLFVHQNFPGQFVHIINYLASSGGHSIVGLGINPLKTTVPKNVNYIRYQPKQSSSALIHPFVIDIETKCIRGDACAEAALKLKKKGFKPDIIYAHPGWGESLFLKDIWPEVPLLNYQEIYYQSHGLDHGFDAEFENKSSWKDEGMIRMKKLFLHACLDAGDWNITPTQFQKNSFPTMWHNKFSVIHDGISIDINRANISKCVSINGQVYRPGEQIITYINRALEPHRGIHTLSRAIPKILTDNPNARIIIVGDSNQAGYGPKPKTGTWKDHFFKEIEDSYEKERVNFAGIISRSELSSMLQISAAHIYLTYPFVLSWSMLEAMSHGCIVIASSTEPVTEVIYNGKNGLLVDFFDANQLAETIKYVLNTKSLSAQIRKNAMQTILDKYNLNHCLKKQLELIKSVAKA